MKKAANFNRKTLTWLVWLLLIITWNYGVPAATPLEDVFVSVILSLITIYINYYKKT
jgi:hypothetical protein